MDDQLTVYEAVGGDKFFIELVDRFYDGVESDALLGPMYPADDFAGARERLALFLVQYWGGPSTYSDKRGHPRLRMRHNPFHVDRQARDAWLGHMLSSLEAADGPAGAVQMIADYFVRTADFMRNVEEPPEAPSGTV